MAPRIANSGRGVPCHEGGLPMGCVKSPNHGPPAASVSSQVGPRLSRTSTSGGVGLRRLVNARNLGLPQNKPQKWQVSCCCPFKPKRGALRHTHVRYATSVTCTIPAGKLADTSPSGFLFGKSSKQMVARTYTFKHSTES